MWLSVRRKFIQGELRLLEHHTTILDGINCFKCCFKCEAYRNVYFATMLWNWYIELHNAVLDGINCFVALIVKLIALQAYFATVLCSWYIELHIESITQFC